MHAVPGEHRTRCVRSCPRWPSSKVIARAVSSAVSEGVPVSQLRRASRSCSAARQLGEPVNAPTESRQSPGSDIARAVGSGSTPWNVTTVSLSRALRVGWSGCAVRELRVRGVTHPMTDTRAHAPIHAPRGALPEPALIVSRRIAQRLERDAITARRLSATSAKGRSGPRAL